MNDAADVPELELDHETQKLFVIQMLCIYREAALTQLVEAEDAIARGIELREHALGLLDRAAALAYEHAKAEDARVSMEKEKDIDW